MERIDFFNLVCNGMANNSKHLNEYIFRQAKEAEKKYVFFDEFFERLNEVITMVINDFIFKHGEQQNRYYLSLNNDSSLPNNNKFYRPEPKIENYGIPFLTYTKGLISSGHFYYNDILS